MTREAAREAEGSRLEAEAERRRPRRLSRRIRHWCSQRLVGLLVRIVPTLYVAYCWLVWRTSRVEGEEEFLSTLNGAADRHGGFVALLWHQEVFTVAYAYRTLRGHTLASVGNFGRIITAMLERCNFLVFRGGSSTGRSRKRQVLTAMIRHMKEEPRVPYGITVDGSNGPVYRLKPGGVLIARACKTPIYLVRLFYSRRIELPTWDRTGIPLPFGRLVYRIVGPYWADPDARSEGVERFRRHVEEELTELCDQSYRDLDGAPDLRVRSRFVETWTPGRWAPGAPGLKHGPWDLDPERPPPWAARGAADPEPV